ELLPPIFTLEEEEEEEEEEEPSGLVTNNQFGFGHLCNHLCPSSYDCDLI
ncbi:hypothetical protein QR98_0100270, partial [Sarcoptes scabiei]